MKFAMVTVAIRMAVRQLGIISLPAAQPPTLTWECAAIAAFVLVVVPFACSGRQAWQEKAWVDHSRSWGPNVSVDVL